MSQQRGLGRGAGYRREREENQEDKVGPGRVRGAAGRGGSGTALCCGVVYGADERQNK